MNSVEDVLTFLREAVPDFLSTQLLHASADEWHITIEPWDSQKDRGVRRFGRHYRD